VEGTENILDCSLNNGVKRVVHFSTIDVYGNAEGEIDESCPCKTVGSAYGDSKIMAEEICRTYIQRGLPLVVLRPTIVYGPYCKLWISKFAERLHSGNWGTFNQLGDGTCNLVYVQDVIQAVYRALTSEKAPGEVFNIGGPDNISWNEYFRLLNTMLGFPQLREIRKFKVAFKLAITGPVRSAAKLFLKHSKHAVKKIYQSSDFARTLMKQTERFLTTSPSSNELGQFGRKVQYDIAKARSLLGYEPKIGIEKGLALSVSWLAHETCSPSHT
jgi:nucleoside-diphosphate-sugar epimerase